MDKYRQEFNDGWEDEVDFPESEINRMMVYTGVHDLETRIVTNDGIVYEGRTSGYSHEQDEDDEIPKIYIITKDKGNWCIGMDEIKEIEEIGG